MSNSAKGRTGTNDAGALAATEAQILRNIERQLEAVRDGGEPGMVEERDMFKIGFVRLVPLHGGQYFQIGREFDAFAQSYDCEVSGPYFPGDPEADTYYLLHRKKAA